MQQPESPRIGEAERSDSEELLRLFAQAGMAVDVEAEIDRSFARTWVLREPGATRIAAALVAWQVADELHVQHVATLADCRRRGFGKALLHRALEVARARGFTRALLEVHHENEAAILLYRSLGFRTVRLRRAYYKDGGDALELDLPLEPLDISKH